MPCQPSGWQPLLAKVRQCQQCQPYLPLPAKPVLQFAPSARILIVGQAPGRKAHEAGIPFADVSGDRLRDWLGVSRAQFYDPTLFALLPMGFCYPGTGNGGDRPPRPECAKIWRARLLAHLSQVELTLVLGQYACAYHFADAHTGTLTALVQRWREFWPTRVPMPHPSPRNIRWLKANPWFAGQLLPALQTQVARLIGD